MFRGRVGWLRNGLALSILAGGILTLGMAIGLRGRILPGVFVSGVDVGACTEVQAALRVRKAGFTGNRRLTLIQGNREWNTCAARMGVGPDIAGAVRAALQYGRRGMLAARITGMWRHCLFGAKIDIPVCWKVDPIRWNRGFSPLAAAIYHAPQNACYDLESGGISPDMPGLMADGSLTVASVKKALAAGETRVAVAVKTVAPATSAGDLSAIGARHILARFSTRFDPGDADRSHNIALAASRINGVSVAPGAEFSVNRAVGRCTLAAGFRPAMEIVNRELVPGVGGGVCQVATTLYNAVLLAGLKVVERRPHSLLLGYIPPGRDATVYYGRVDLRFRNTTGGFVVILAGVSGDTVQVALLGSEKPLHKYSLLHHIIEIFEPAEEIQLESGLASGEIRVENEGKPGCLVEVWRHASNGTRERISVDTYPPVDRRVVMAPGHPKAPSEMPEELEQKHRRMNSR